MGKNLNFDYSVLFLSQQLHSGKPMAIGKIGINELRAIYQFRNNAWTEDTLFKLYHNNGIFPETESVRGQFINEISTSISHMDALPIWSYFNKNFEETFINEVNNDCIFIDVRSLEPYYSQIPWTKQLENKKVLVISPFITSIEKQYEKKELVWPDKNILPNFELKTLKHQLCPALGTPSEYDSWIEMLADMKRKISIIDFDIALIGTGGSSLPLAAYCKQIGKQAIHLGGSLQILFGIKGHRWDNKPHISCFYNEHWTRPSGNEVPENHKKNEDGCYW